MEFRKDKSNLGIITVMVFIHAVLVTLAWLALYIVEEYFDLDIPTYIHLTGAIIFLYVWCKSDLVLGNYNSYHLLKRMGSLEIPKDPTHIYGGGGYIMGLTVFGIEVISWKEVDGSTDTENLHEFEVPLGSYNTDKGVRAYKIRANLSRTGSWDPNVVGQKAIDSAKSRVNVVISTEMRNICTFLKTDKSTPETSAISKPEDIIDGKALVQKILNENLLKVGSPENLALRKAGYVLDPNLGVEIRTLLVDEDISEAAEKIRIAEMQREQSGINAQAEAANLGTVATSIANNTAMVAQALSGKDETGKPKEPGMLEKILASFLVSKGSHIPGITPVTEKHKKE